MGRIRAITRAGLGLAALSALAAVTLDATPAQAVVYCKTVGIPQGCVARPGAPVVVGAPVARAAVATPAYRGAAYRGVGAGARGVGVRPGTPANRGGPVNRVGRR